MFADPVHHASPICGRSLDGWTSYGVTEEGLTAHPLSDAVAAGP